VENWAFLARDADLLEQLSSSQRVKAEGVLTSFEQAPRTTTLLT